MRSGTFRMLKLSKNVCVPFLIYAVSISTVCLVRILNFKYLYIKKKTNGIEKIYSNYYT